jgi:hypothetical protein
MSNDNFDFETKTIIAEGEALSAMFESSGWKIAERELMQLIADLQNVSTLDVTDKDLGQQVRDRINTVAALQQWVSDLRGRVNNVIMLQKEPANNKLVTRR